MNIASDGDSGIAGTATLTELSGGRMAVELRLAGPGPPPARPTSTWGAATPWTSRRRRSPCRPAVNGASTSQVEATFQQLLSRPYAIHVHRSAKDSASTSPARHRLPRLRRPRRPRPPWRAPSPEEILYTVVPGDSLSLIAQRVYGDLMQWPRIYQVNQDRIGNPNVVNVGWVLRIPR